MIGSNQDKQVLGQLSRLFPQKSELNIFFGATHRAINLDTGMLWSSFEVSKQSLDEDGYVQSGFVSAMLDNGMATMIMAKRRWSNMNVR